MRKISVSALAALPVCALVLSGCGGSPEAPASQSAASSPAPSSSIVLSQDVAGHIRKAVRDYMAERHPGAEVEGVWIVPIRNNYIIAGADASLNGRRRTVEMLVRHYVREDGGEYWRADGFGHDSSAAHMLRGEELPSGAADEGEE